MCKARKDTKIKEVQIELFVFFHQTQHFVHVRSTKSIKSPPSLEKDKRRHWADLVLSGDVVQYIYVYFEEHDVWVFGSSLFEFGRNPLARAAPLCVEVDDNQPASCLLESSGELCLRADVHDALRGSTLTRKARRRGLWPAFEAQVTNCVQIYVTETVYSND